MVMVPWVKYSWKAPMTAIAAALLMLGCHSVSPHKTPTTYPPLPTSLSQFLKNPVDGLYSLPKPIPSGNVGDLTVMIVSGGKVRLSCSDESGVGTNGWNFVEFKPSLPADEVFQQIATGATEAQIQRYFGTPTWEQSHSETINWKTIPSNIRVVYYRWFSASPASELLFMRLTAIYERASDGVWKVKSLEWAKWQDLKLSSNSIAPRRSWPVWSVTTAYQLP